MKNRKSVGLPWAAMVLLAACVSFLNESHVVVIPMVLNGVAIYEKNDKLLMLTGSSW